MPVGHLHFLFGKLSLQFLYLFLNQAVFLSLMLSCMSCLHTLAINPSSVVSFENTSSHSVDCLFILLIVPLLSKKWPEELFFQRGNADGQQAYEKILNIANHQGNVNQNHHEISTNLSEWLSSKRS